MNDDGTLVGAFNRITTNPVLMITQPAFWKNGEVTIIGEPADDREQYEQLRVINRAGLAVGNKEGHPYQIDTRTLKRSWLDVRVAPRETLHVAKVDDAGLIYGWMDRPGMNWIARGGKVEIVRKPRELQFQDVPITLGSLVKEGRKWDAWLKNGKAVFKSEEGEIEFLPKLPAGWRPTEAVVMAPDGSVVFSALRGPREQTMFLLAPKP